MKWNQVQPQIMTKKTFYDIYHQKNRNGRYYTIISDNSFTYFYTLKYLRKILGLFGVKKLEILDLGCGVGTIDFYLAKKGHAVTGIDISADAIKVCQEVKEQFRFDETEFHQGDVQKTQFLKKYDLVICSEVIEHVEDDTGLLESIYQLLKPGGMLLLTTPSQNAPLYRLGFLKKFDQQVGHLRRYEISGLVDLVDNVGFHIVHTAKTESILRNMLYTFRPLGYLIKVIRGPLVGLFHLVDQLFVTLLGESDLVVIAQKPN
jgi:SAM-dependent methyltransferase